MNILGAGKCREMKILMCETSGFGGGSHYTYNLCQALSDYVKVVLITDNEYELEDYDRSFSIRKVFKKNYGYLRKVYHLFCVIFKEKPDILHFQSIFTARKDWILFRILKLWKLPVIFTVHNVFPHDDFQKDAKGMKFSLKNIYTSCEALISHYAGNKGELAKKFNIPPKKIFTIAHGNYLFHADGKCRDKAKKCEEARKKLGLKKEDKVMLCFGTVRDYKGMAYLIPAFSQVLQRIPNAKLVIAGDSWEFTSRKYAKLIKDHNLEDFVLYRPEYIPIKDIPLYFYSADLAVLPYLHTYGSGALHLAFAFSLPVVVTGVGIFPEMVKHEKNGYIVPPGDTDALAKSMIELLSYPERAEKMGKYARHLEETEYSWDMVAQKTSKVYKLTKCACSVKSKNVK